MTDKSTKTIGEQLVQKREPYWEYMGRRLREERPKIVTESEMYRREITDMNRQLYTLMIKVTEMREEIEKEVLEEYSIIQSYNKLGKVLTTIKLTDSKKVNNNS